MFNYDQNWTNWKPHKNEIIFIDLYVKNIHFQFIKKSVDYFIESSVTLYF